MESNPEFLLDADYLVFHDVSTDISSSCARYRESKSNSLSLMVEKLFAQSDETHDRTLAILKSYGSTVQTRLTASQGGAAEFLEGGKLHNVTDVRSNAGKYVTTDGRQELLTSRCGYDQDESSGWVTSNAWAHNNC